jgi:hypothetical protein
MEILFSDVIFYLTISIFNSRFSTNYMILIRIRSHINPATGGSVEKDQVGGGPTTYDILFQKTLSNKGFTQLSSQL